MSISDLVGENICRLKPYSPGKPIEEVQREYGLTDIIKMASNENPLGPSPKAVEAMKRAVEKVALYPEGSCYLLKKALAAHWSVCEDQLIIGNGSDEIIRYIGLAFLRAGDEVIQGDVTFSQYEAAATLGDCGCVCAPMRSFTYDLDAMSDRINERTRLVFIPNPNNPTGTAVKQKDVDRFMAKLPKRVFAIFDEAYYEYVDDPDFPRIMDYVESGANAIILRTFSKIYALAGLRVGYGIARPEIVQCLEQVRQPFNVNSVAQAGAIASLADPGQVERSRRNNEVGKRFLYGEFDRMGLRYEPTQANFIWVDLGRECRPVFTELLKRGVIIRTGDVFGCSTFIRVTIGTEAENERFISTLKEVLAL